MLLGQPWVLFTFLHLETALRHQPAVRSPTDHESRVSQSGETIMSSRVLVAGRDGTQDTASKIAHLTSRLPDSECLARGERETGPAHHPGRGSLAEHKDKTA